MVDEFELIASLRPLLAADAPGVVVGPGDDAAVLEVGGGAALVVLAVDTMVQGVHVDLGLSSLADLGFKVLAVNLSDLAAMAAEPVGAVVSLQRPPAFGREDARQLYEGMAEAAERFSCPLVGGDVVGAETLAVSVTVLGEPADGPLRRGGAVVGDVVVVIGPLGLAAAGLGLWQRGLRAALDARPELSRAHRRPEPMLDAVPALVAARPSAGIDVSDGLGRDLGHVADASGVAVQLDPQRLPVAPDVAAAADRLGVEPIDLVVGGGDDYALAVTLPRERLGELRAGLAEVDRRAVVVGEVTDGSAVWLDGVDVSRRGWEHRGGDPAPDDEGGHP